MSWVEAISPGAARSLQEGLEETLTVTCLELHEDLIKTFASTKLIESCLSRAEEFTWRVEHWRSGEMFARWERRRSYSLRNVFRKCAAIATCTNLPPPCKRKTFDRRTVAA